LPAAWLMRGFGRTKVSALQFSQVAVICGLYRAEFSHDRSGRAAPQEKEKDLHHLGRKIQGPPPIEEWISWVNPRTKEPDFHVPASLGWLEFGWER
jgi:hypothetical protein